MTETGSKSTAYGRMNLGITSALKAACGAVGLPIPDALMLYYHILSKEAPLLSGVMGKKEKCPCMPRHDGQHRVRCERREAKVTYPYSALWASALSTISSKIVINLVIKVDFVEIFFLDVHCPLRT